MHISLLILASFALAQVMALPKPSESQDWPESLPQHPSEDTSDPHWPDYLRNIYDTAPTPRSQSPTPAGPPPHQQGHPNQHQASIPPSANPLVFPSTSLQRLTHPDTMQSGGPGGGMYQQAQDGSMFAPGGQLTGGGWSSGGSQSQIPGEGQGSFYRQAQPQGSSSSQRGGSGQGRPFSQQTFDRDRGHDGMFEPIVIQPMSEGLSAGRSRTSTQRRVDSTCRAIPGLCNCKAVLGVIYEHKLGMPVQKCERDDRFVGWKEMRGDPGAPTDDRCYKRMNAYGEPNELPLQGDNSGLVRCFTFIWDGKFTESDLERLERRLRVSEGRVA